MGIRLAFCICAFLILSSSTSGAVTVSIVRATSSSGAAPLAIGDTVTLDIRISQASGDPPPYGLGISAHGYDESVADFVSGQATTSFFNSAIVGGEPVGGLTNFANTRSGNPPGSLDISETTRPRAGRHIVELFISASLSPATGDGSLDRGVDGGSIASGDVHARIVFAIMGAGLTTLLIDSSYPGDLVNLAGGATAEAVGTAIVLGPGVVVPEPRPALLLGLAFAGLSRVGRRH